MADETLFATLFVLSFVAFWIIRMYYVRKTRDPNAPRSRQERREAMKKEGWTGIAIFLLMPVELVIIIIYFLFPTWLSWTFLGIPEIVRWIGLIIAAVSIVAVEWVHRTLGHSYSYALETKQEQKLVTSGPFSRVRHPLYSAHNLFNLGKIAFSVTVRTDSGYFA